MQIGPREVGTPAHGRREIGVGKIGVAELRVFERCPRGLRLQPQRLPQLASNQLRSGEGGAGKHSLQQMRAAEIGTIERGPGEIGIRPLHLPGVCAGEIAATAVAALDRGPGEHGPRQVDARHQAVAKHNASEIHAGELCAAHAALLERGAGKTHRQQWHVLERRSRKPHIAEIGLVELNTPQRAALHLRLCKRCPREI